MRSPRPTTPATPNAARNIEGSPKSMFQFPKGLQVPETLSRSKSLLRKMKKSPAKTTMWTEQSSPVVASPETSQSAETSSKRGMVSNIAKSRMRRKGSIASMLSLPAFGTRSSKKNEKTLSISSPKPESPATFKSPKLGTGISHTEATAFRCDIHGVNGADHTAAEAECKQLIIEAGGTILADEFLYPGGFLYEMGDPANVNPLDDGDETSGRGHIHIFPWIRFQPPQFNSLRMHPVIHRQIGSLTPALPQEQGLPPLPPSRSPSPSDECLPVELANRRSSRICSWVEEVQDADSDEETIPSVYVTPEERSASNEEATLSDRGTPNEQAMFEERS